MFFCPHEQYDPSTLLGHAELAAAAGFDSAWTSDYFHPWWHSGAHYGAAWPWLGAALEAGAASADRDPGEISQTKQLTVYGGSYEDAVARHENAGYDEFLSSSPSQEAFVEEAATRLL